MDTTKLKQARRLLYETLDAYFRDPALNVDLLSSLLADLENVLLEAESARDEA
jgi:hypothetical protein